jgi:hypothetical protein
MGPDLHLHLPTHHVEDETIARYTHIHTYTWKDTFTFRGTPAVSNERPNNRGREKEENE